MVFLEKINNLTTLQLVCIYSILFVLVGFIAITQVSRKSLGQVAPSLPDRAKVDTHQRAYFAKYGEYDQIVKGGDKTLDSKEKNKLDVSSTTRVNVYETKQGKGYQIVETRMVSVPNRTATSTHVLVEQEKRTAFGPNANDFTYDWR